MPINILIKTMLIPDNMMPNAADSVNRMPLDSIEKPLTITVHSMLLSVLSF